MTGTKFLRLLATLSKEELKEFEKFLKSPYFNTRNQPVLLFQYLKSTYSRWHPLYLEYAATSTSRERKAELEQKLHEVLAKKKVAAVIFPNERYNDPRMRRVIHYCKQLIEEFFYQLAPKADHEFYLRHIAMLQHHLLRGELDLFEDLLEEVREIQQKTSFRDHQFYYYAYQLEEVTNDYLIRTARNLDAFQPMSDNFDVYFILNKLRMSCGMATRDKMFGRGYEYPMMEELIAYIEKTDFSTVPLIGMYYHIFHLEQNKEDRMHYKALQTLLQENKGQISLGERRQISGFMLNYLTRENRKPGQKMSWELFDLFRTMVGEGLVYINGMITVPYFNLGLRAACRVGEFDWGEQFIHDHTDRLLGKNAKEVLDLSRLVVQYNRGEYQQVLRKIDTLKFKDSRQQVFRRILKLQTLYEINEPNQFFQLTDAFKRFIRAKQEIGTTASTFFSNFVSFSERLGRIKFDLKPVKSGLEEEIQHSATAEKDWLIDKIKELQVH